MPKLACVAVVKNEERHIAEWVAYQFAVGFDTVILLDNASTDATKARASLFARRHDLRLVDWPMATPEYQRRGYEEAISRFGAEFAWMAFFDADEFLVLDGSLHAALADRDGTDAIGINWAIFGSAGHGTPPPGLTIESYRQRSGRGFFPNRHVKSIVRPDRVEACLNPHVFKVRTPYRDLAGREIFWQQPGVRMQPPDYQGGKLHHYFTRSQQDWAAKIRRGYPDITRQMHEFANYDHNDIFDDAAAKMAPAVSKLIDELNSPSQKTESCAVILVVKDEVSDIAAWLAWYAMLGFDAFIVFDDHSTDGTWELLQAAAARLDIRLSRTIGALDRRYQDRQRECYISAINQYRDEFAWLAVFDADEFLLLRQDDSVKSFLQRFAGADAVAVNWCNYGSSGHILKPQAPPVAAYTWHGDERMLINRHVKSLFRPQKLGKDWICVHIFDVDPDRYVLANGTPYRSGPTPGISDQDADWNVAKLMHYQCRSMEHFIERMKKRPELAGRANIWAGYDVNVVQDISPLRLLDQVERQMSLLLREAAQPEPAKGPARPEAAAPAAAESRAGLVFDIGMSEGNDSAFYLAKGFRVVGVEADAQAYYHLCERFDEQIKSGQIKIYNFAAGATNGEIITFFHHDQHQGISGLSHARSEFKDGNYSSYHVSTINWQALTAENGVPFYLKIDIEGQEHAFLSGLANGAKLPEYTSVECHTLAPVETLHALGYRRFKLIDQNPPGGFRLPAAQQEGEAIDWPTFQHSSGPFGRDLPEGPWLSLDDFKTAWQAAQPDYARTWFDCHAWMP